MSRVKKLADKYPQVLPHEIPLFKDQIEDFYKEIGFEEGYKNIDLFVDDISKTISSSPYHFFIVALDKDNKPLGYIWFYVDVNIVGQSYMNIEHDYIVPEHRNSLRGARIHKNLIERVIEASNRCNCVYTNTVVRNEKLKKSRERMGFKTVEYKMRFDGTGKDFVEQNPLFTQYVKS